MGQSFGKTGVHSERIGQNVRAARMDARMGSGRKGECGNRGCALEEALGIDRNGILLRRGWQQLWREGAGAWTSWRAKQADIVKRGWYEHRVGVEEGCGRQLRF